MQRLLLLFLWVVLMPVSVTVSHALSATTPDNTSYEIRPTHWNSGHTVTASLDVSATEISGLFSNANGISFGTSDSKITLTHGLQFTSATSAITSAAMLSTSRPAFSADASSTFQTLTFQDSNGVSFSNNAGAIRVTHGLQFTSATSAITSAAMLSTSRPAVSAGTQASSTFQTLSFSNANGVSWSTVAGGLVASVAAQTNQTLGLYMSSNTTSSVSSGTVDARSMTFRGMGNISVGYSGGEVIVSAVGGGGAVVSNALQDVGTATGSGTNTSRFAADDHVHRGVVGVVAVGTATTFYGSVHISAGNNVTLSTGGASTAGSIAIHVAAPGGAATYSNFFEPYFLHEATATTTGGQNTLNVQAFSLPVNLSFGQINIIGSHAFATSAGNTFSFRLTPNTNMRTVQGFTITNSCLIDLFLFSRGTGSYSTDLESVASTRNSVLHNFFHTFDGSVNHTGGSTGSVTLRRTVSVGLTYPTMTSATTSPAAGTTHTIWATGTGTWASTASNSVTNTYNTTNTASTSLASTHPAITEWSSYKMWPMAFGKSLTPGEWCIGLLQSGSTSSSSSSANTNMGASQNSATVTYNASAMTESGSFSWVGDTNVIASSLAWPGQNTANSMAPSPGQGSLSATYSPASTYNNSAGNPAGAFAFSQLRTQISFFRTWMQFASQRI